MKLTNINVPWKVLRMPKVLMSFDAHDRKSAGRPAFEKLLEARHWVNYFILRNDYYQLPETTFISNKSLASIKSDIKAGEAAGLKADTTFRITKQVTCSMHIELIRDVKSRAALPAEITLFKAAWDYEK